MEVKKSQPGDFNDWLRVLRHVGTAITASAPGGAGATAVGGILTAPRFRWFFRIIVRQTWREVAIGASLVLVLRRIVRNWIRWSVVALTTGFLLRVRLKLKLKTDVKVPSVKLPPLAEGWTEEQEKLVKWLASNTYKLPSMEVDAVWGMGNESKQVSFTSRRYHLAFSFYSACAAFQHEPGQIEEARRILDWLMKEMLQYKSWSYVRLYWPDEQDPFKCSENIMWTGHVLAMATLYEALLGDDRFRNRISAIDDNGTEHVTTTRDLAQHIANLYRSRPHGVCCEPGLVFFMCQNHPLHGLRLEQQLHPDVCFDDIFATWESFALKSFGADFGGVFQMLQVNKMPLAVGHIGGDGWSFTYWPAWSPSLTTVQAVWHAHLRPLLDPVLAELTDIRAPDPFGGPPSKGCLCLDLPRSVTAAYLFSAAAAVGDEDVARHLYAFLRTLQRHDGSLMDGRDWSMASTAQVLLGLSTLRGASLRNIRSMKSGWTMM